MIPTFHSSARKLSRLASDSIDIDGRRAEERDERVERVRSSGRPLGPGKLWAAWTTKNMGIVSVGIVSPVVTRSFLVCL